MAIASMKILLPQWNLSSLPPIWTRKIAHKKGFHSVESDESIPGEGLMVDARRASREEEFFRINQGADPTGQLLDVTDHCRQLPLHLRLPVQWLNECLDKVNWKDLRQHSQGLPSHYDTMVYFSQVNS